MADLKDSGATEGDVADLTDVIETLVTFEGEHLPIVLR